MANVIYNSTGLEYKPGVTYHSVYPKTGAAIDWVYSSGVPQSYAIGDILPPKQIEDTGKETFTAAEELARAIEPDFYRRGREGPWF